MNKEQGLLNTPETAKNVLSSIEGINLAAKGKNGNASLVKLGAGLSNEGDANSPAIVEMHKDMAVAMGSTKAAYEQTAAQELANSVLPRKYSEQEWAEGLVPSLLDKEAEKQKYNEIASQAISNAKQNG